MTATHCPTMSAPSVWHEFTTQRLRRYHLVPKLLRLARGYLAKEEKIVLDLTARLDRARHLQSLGLILLGEQMEAEKNFTREVHTLLVCCQHHHSLILKNDFCDLQHELLDAEAHLTALQGLLVGEWRRAQK